MCFLQKREPLGFVCTLVAMHSLPSDCSRSTPSHPWQALCNAKSPSFWFSRVAYAKRPPRLSLFCRQNAYSKAFQHVQDAPVNHSCRAGVQLSVSNACAIPVLTTWKDEKRVKYWLGFVMRLFLGVKDPCLWSCSSALLDPEASSLLEVMWVLAVPLNLSFADPTPNSPQDW